MDGLFPDGLCKHAVDGNVFFQILDARRENLPSLLAVSR